MTSATVTPALEAAGRSTWSLPMPAVSASFSLGALAMRSAVMYAGQKGVVITCAQVPLKIPNRSEACVDHSTAHVCRSSPCSTVMSAMMDPCMHVWHAAATRTQPLPVEHGQAVPFLAALEACMHACNAMQCIWGVYWEV